MTAASCPIIQDTRQIQGLSHDLTRVLRKLRRDIQKCRDCPSFDNCATLREFNSAVTIALDEVSGEWDAVTNSTLEERS